MISYVTLGVNDLTAAKAFYGELLGELGSKSLLDMGRIAFFGKSMAQPMLAVCVPFNQQPANPGNGNMVSFQPGSKEKVDALYHKAIALVPNEPKKVMPFGVMPIRNKNTATGSTTRETGLRKMALNIVSTS